MMSLGFKIKDRQFVKYLNDLCRDTGRKNASCLMGIYPRKSARSSQAWRKD